MSPAKPSLQALIAAKYAAEWAVPDYQRWSQCALCRIDFQDPKDYKKHVGLSSHVEKMIQQGKISYHLVSEAYPLVLASRPQEFEAVSMLHRDIKGYDCPICSRSWATFEKYSEEHTSEECERYLRNRQTCCAVVGCGKRFIEMGRGNYKRHIRRAHFPDVPESSALCISSNIHANQIRQRQTFTLS